MSRYTGWVRWRIADGTPPDVASRARGQARKVMGELMEGRALSGNMQGSLHRRLRDGTDIVARFDGTTPIIEISAAPSGGGADRCIGLIGHLSGPTTIDSWPDIQPRPGIAVHKLSYFNIAAVYDRVYLWGNQAAYVNDQAATTLYEYRHSDRAVVATGRLANAGYFMPGVAIDDHTPVADKDGYRSGYSPSADVADDATTPFFSLAQQTLAQFDLDTGDVAYRYLVGSDGSTPNQLDRVYGSSVGRMAMPGVNVNGALQRDVSLMVPRMALHFSADDGMTADMCVAFELRDPTPEGGIFVNSGGPVIVFPAGTTPLYPTIAAKYKNQMDLYGFLPTRPPPAGATVEVAPALRQVSSFVPTPDMIHTTVALPRTKGHIDRIDVAGHLAVMKTAFASQFACTAQVCASVVTAGIWDAAGNPSGDVILHEIGKDAMHVIGHIPELDNIYVNAIARAVPLHDRVLVFVPVAHAERSGDSTPHPQTMVDAMRVYEIT